MLEELQLLLVDGVRDQLLDFEILQVGGKLALQIFDPELTNLFAHRVILCQFGLRREGYNGIHMVRIDFFDNVPPYTLGDRLKLLECILSIADERGALDARPDDVLPGGSLVLVCGPAAVLAVGVWRAL